MRPPIIAAALLLLAPVATFAQPQGPPRFGAPIFATIQPEPLVLIGRGFGAPGPHARLVVRMDGREVAVASTSGRILAWEDDRIVVATDAGTPSATVRVKTAEGQTPFVPAEVYDYTSYDIPPTPGTNAVPSPSPSAPTGRCG